MAAKKASKKSSKKTGKKPSKRAGGRPAAGTPTKADFIRSKLAEGMSAADIIKAGAGAGLSIAAPQVYKLKAKGKAPAKSAAPGSKPSAPKAGKLTASNFIRQHAGKSAGEIVKLGAAAGLKFGESSVYQTRAYDKKRSGAPKGRPGKKPVAATSNGETTFKKLALEIGFPRAREIVVELERKWNELLA